MNVVSDPSPATARVGFSEQPVTLHPLERAPFSRRSHQAAIRHAFGVFMPLACAAAMARPPQVGYILVTTAVATRSVDQPNGERPSACETGGGPRMTPVPVSQLVVAVAVALLLLVATLALSRWHVRWRLRRRWSHARAVERQAAHLLEDFGYTVLARQIDISYTVLVDGQPTEVPLRADYLVSRGGRQFVAEVKSGSVAPRLDTAATRRQLLEYLVAFQVDGVLLVDGEQRQVHEVTFPMARSQAGEVSSARFTVYVIIALFVAFGLWALSHRL